LSSSKARSPILPQLVFVERLPGGSFTSRQRVAALAAVLIESPLNFIALFPPSVSSGGMLAYSNEEACSIPETALDYFHTQCSFCLFRYVGIDPMHRKEQTYFTNLFQM